MSFSCCNGDSDKEKENKNSDSIGPKKGNFKFFCGGMMLWYLMSGIEYGITLGNIYIYYIIEYYLL